MAERTDEVVLRDLWLPVLWLPPSAASSSAVAPSSPFSAPSASSPPALAASAASSAAASRASMTQGGSVPVTNAQKLRHRLAAVSDCGASLLRTYHLTYRTGGAPRVKCHRRCALRPNTSFGQPTHSSQLSGASLSFAMPKQVVMNTVTGMAAQPGARE